MKIRRLMILFMVFGLAACNAVSSPTVAPSPFSPTASMTATSTRVPGTPAATRTPTPDFSATEFWVTSTAIVEAVMGTQQPRTYESYPSPDGKWLAEILMYDCMKVDPRPEADANAYEQLRLVKGSSGEITTADGQLQNCGGLGAFGLEGLFWSQNSRYFYYTDSREGVPDGCGGYWQKPILRLEINTLRTETLGAGFLSPDGRKIAAWDEEELVIWDVSEGDEVGRISPASLNRETGAGPVIWSPDSQAFVYIQAVSFCPVAGKSSVVHVTLSTLKQEVLLESESPTFGDADWNKNNVLVLFDENGNRWVYTFDTQELKHSP